MLPGKDGFAVATELRAAKQFVPVLMLTARGRPEDVLKGFASGADDYLPKPFELPILLARLQGFCAAVSGCASARRKRPATDEAFSFHGRTIDFGKLELRVDGNTIQLTLMEADLLRHLFATAADRFAQSHSRRSLGSARRHRYSCHRQLHRPPAPLHRRRSRQATAFAHRPRRRLPLRPRTGEKLARLPGLAAINQHSRNFFQDF